MIGRLLALLACMALLAGCGQSVTTTATSSADPSSVVAIDSLPLTLAEVQEKTNLPVREQHPSSRKLPAPNEVWSNPALTQFIRVSAGTPDTDPDGKRINEDVEGFYLVTQTIAFYRDNNSAQAVFDKISKGMRDQPGATVASVGNESIVVNSEQQAVGKEVTVLRKARSALAQVYLVPATSNSGAIDIGNAIVSKINQAD
ncbi:hypothetical protein P3F83_08025 [Mycobacteroides immunogenum]|uniref:hypothetical protein n=1 Tax=Mycobacteroides immunogenum TaxID=83262 RepID=UPI0025B75A7A|nr:hypothetical protein [Mycobacteroides immunogenum]WJR35305.1 hypothetical protein P3F83_08025 [Mycobacteroides immunogenum]